MIYWVSLSVGFKGIHSTYHRNKKALKGIQRAGFTLPWLSGVVGVALPDRRDCNRSTLPGAAASGL